MTISLTPEHEKWLQEAVAEGRFASIEAAVHFAIEHLFAPIDMDDLSWAKPLIDEAREQIARGETVTLEEFNAHIDKRLSGIRE